MNVLKLESVSHEKIQYLYQPEGEGDFGEITYDRASKNAVLLKKASHDTNNSRYANKAISKIYDFIETNNLPLQYTQAWY